MFQNSPFGERRNMLYLIEITKLNGKSLRNGWNAPRIGQRGWKERGQEPKGRGLYIKKYGKNGEAGALEQGALPQKFLPYISERLLFALVAEHGEEVFELARGLGMHLEPCMSAHEVIIGGGIGIVLALIDLARADAVAEHLDKVLFRHFYRGHHMRDGIIVRPVFKVMTVAALVVHPGKRIAVVRTLQLVGAAAAACIMLNARDKFGRGEFGYIMPESAPRNTGFAAVDEYGAAVACDGGKMSEEIGTHFLASLYR